MQALAMITRDKEVDGKKSTDTLLCWLDTGMGVRQGFGTHFNPMHLIIWYY